MIKITPNINARTTFISLCAEISLRYAIHWAESQHISLATIELWAVNHFPHITDILETVQDHYNKIPTHREEEISTVEY